MVEGEEGQEVMEEEEEAMARLHPRSLRICKKTTSSGTGFPSR